MATTLAAIISVAQSAVAGTERADGALWMPKQGIDDPDQMNAADADGGFSFEFPDERRQAKVTGLDAVQVVNRRAHLVLYRACSGEDQAVAMAQLDDDARAVSDAVELATYPAGTEIVQVEGQRVEPFSPGFIRARLVVLFQFQATYGVA